MIDRPAGRDEEDGYVGRSASQAPDIDSVTFVHGNVVELHPGQLLSAKVTDFQAYDLVAELPRKKSRTALSIPIIVRRENLRTYTN